MSNPTQCRFNRLEPMMILTDDHIAPCALFLSPTNNIALVEVCQNANMYRVEVVQLTIKRSGGHHKK